MRKNFLLTALFVAICMVVIPQLIKEPAADGQPAIPDTIVTATDVHMSERRLENQLDNAGKIIKAIPEPDKKPKPKVVTRKVPVPPENLTYYYRIAGNVYQGQVKKDGGFYVIDIDSLVANAKVTDTVILHHTDTVYLKKHGWLYKMFHKR